MSAASRFRLFAAFVVFAAMCAAAVASQAASKTADVCREALQTVFDQGRFPGATLGVVLPDGSVHGFAVGNVAGEGGRALRTGDRMMSGSVGKTYVAACAYDLIAKGKLALDDKVAKHLGDLPWYSKVQNAADITVRDLLRHTSGIPRYVFKREFWAACTSDADRVWKPEELIAFVFDDKPLFAAGEGWAYADTNYLILGLVLEKASGVAFYDYCREHVLEPHGLRDTLASDKRQLPGLIPGQSAMAKQLGLPEFVLQDGKYVVNPQFEGCGGGFYGTATDLAKWAKLLWTGKALPSNYLDTMLDAVPAKMFGAGGSYGSGVILRKTGVGRSIGHDGFFPGYMTTAAWFPDLGLAAAIQINRDGPVGIATHTALVQIVQQIHAKLGDELAMLERARTIHDRVLTLDTHKDISPLLAREAPQDPVERRRFRRRYDPTFRGSAQVDFPKMREGGLDCAFFIVYVGQGPLTDTGYFRAKKSALAKFDAIHRMAARFPKDIELALTADDVERIAAEGKLIACIGIENGYPMGKDLGLVEEFWKRGARYMSITHNRHSQLGDSHTPTEPLHGGLTDLGRKAIEEMNRVGIMVDVSHASKKTMLEAVAHSKAPVLASHSAVHALYAHGRNLDDEQLLALKENGGVIQVVAFASYLKDYTARQKRVRALREELGLGRRRRQAPSTPELEAKIARYRKALAAIDREFPPTDVGDLCDHIDYAVKKIGIDHVAISSDFDGGGGIRGWNDASETFHVTVELLRRGYSEAQIEKLWSKNTLRVWRAVEEYAKSQK